MAIHELSTPTNRSGRRSRWLFVLIVSVAILGACGDSGSDAEADKNGAGAESSITGSETPRTTDADPATTSDEAGDTTSAPEPDAGTGDPQELARLREAVEATIARGSARFSLDVTQTLPVAGPNQASMRRTGAFDDGLQIGSGTQQFLGRTGAFADLPGYAGEEIEHRLVDGTYWLLNPVSDPPSWIGYDVAAFADLGQSDPAVSVDGDIYLRTLGDALTSVTDVVEFDDGSQGWTVRAVADELLPLVVTGGVQNQLGAAGLQPTDLEATVSLAVDPDGMVVGFIADLNEWWQAVIDQTAGASDAPAGMVFQFQIGDFDAAVDVDTPCATPEEVVEPDTPPALICEG